MGIMSEIKVGTCGYSYYNPPEGWKEKYESKLQAYSAVFDVGELNRTFYKLPMVRTAERWRREAFDDFDFCLKGWQALTHPTTSPTWRNKKDGLTDEQKEKFGYFRPVGPVFEAWEETRKIAEALNAEVCVLQTSASFECSEGNKGNMVEFFDEIERRDFEIAWEPRGDWKDNPDEVEDLCDDLDLIHVVDIMRRESKSDHEFAYVRLHGLNPGEHDYDYDYSDEELSELATKLRRLSEGHEKVYCMFNNYEMYDNARSLVEKL